MLPWWGWVLLVLVLLAATAVLLGLRLRWLWRRFRALLRELERSETTLSALEDRAEELASAASSSAGAHGPGPSVLASPTELRAGYAADRATQRAVRDARRARDWPPWATPRARAQQTPSRGHVD